jgi:hypothetical protein
MGLHEIGQIDRMQTIHTNQQNAPKTAVVNIVGDRTKLSRQRGDEQWQQELVDSKESFHSTRSVRVLCYRPIRRRKKIREWPCCSTFRITEY